VLIAACDTFRSGAVEQLKVHARCLEVDLYDKGYHKDPAAVAREAIKDATAVSSVVPSWPVSSHLAGRKI